uniref:Dihydroorotate dehydrogenase n=1 Tax=uncultured marine group II/III euryarchaeote KM3_83_G03 TaxID=1456522 RepID=A0A075HVU4_9EURY|nr:dihydroorotate dehydrogenase (pyrD) [uncultured marine group II/III euryarchaeote KM3_83_G03]
MYEEMSLKTSFAGIELQHCIMNASGPKCVTEEDLIALGESHSSAIVTKTNTLDPRDGNPKPRYEEMDFGSINSSGLPNLGYEKYIELMSKLKGFDKPVIASIGGLCKEDNLKMVEAYNESEVDAIELNLSCPNLIGKPQVGYDFEASDEILGDVMKITKKPLGVKLPPYFDFVHFEAMAKILNKHKVSFVTCINSLGNALHIDPEKEMVTIKPKGGFGGLGGSYVKPTALANVRKFYELLDSSIDIIGVGGINSGIDVFEHILAGAKAVQIGTVFMQEGDAAFTRIEDDFNNYMEKKGYSSIEEIRGKLKNME